MRMILLAFALSTELLGEEIEQKTEEKEELCMKPFLERVDPSPSPQNKAEGKITRNKSSIEWQDKIGNLEITISAENTEPQGQWQAQWEKNSSQRLSDKKSDDKKKNKPNRQQEKSTDPSVHFSLSWSSDD